MLSPPCFPFVEVNPSPSFDANANGWHRLALFGNKNRISHYSTVTCPTAPYTDGGYSNPKAQANFRAPTAYVFNCENTKPAACRNDYADRRRYADSAAPPWSASTTRNGRAPEGFRRAGRRRQGRSPCLRNLRLVSRTTSPTLTDPRRRKVTYPLVNIVTIAICAVICGADDFVAIAKFGRVKQKWLSRFLDLKDGIPSHDRFNAILAAIKPAEFEACLLSWITALHEITDGQLVAIDGKTLRRSFDAASSKSAIHMVSAWATANHISLGQVTVDEKSNEITAIPKLLKMLEISGSLVTIDAMGCQTEIAKTIIDSKADYVLAVKKNQPTLYDGISWFFLTQREQDFAGVRVSRHQTHEKGHGREETRLYYVCSVPRDLPDRKRWPKLAAIGWTISDTMRGGKALLRDAVLHHEQEALGQRVRRRGTWPLVDRKQPSLATRRDVRRGSIAPAPRTCRRELQHPPPYGAEPAEEQQDAKGRRERSRRTN